MQKAAGISCSQLPIRIEIRSMPVGIRAGGALDFLGS